MLAGHDHRAPSGKLALAARAVAAEELGLQHDVVRYERDKASSLAPPALKAVHPLGKSPVITDDGQVIAETGAIVEYVIERYGNGRMIPPRERPTACATRTGCTWRRARPCRCWS
jgi:glutathione S-transferase